MLNLDKKTPATSACENTALLAPKENQEIKFIAAQPEENLAKSQTQVHMGRDVTAPGICCVIFNCLMETVTHVNAFCEDAGRQMPYAGM